MIFQQKLLEEAYCFVKMTGPAMVRPVGSDFWKAPLLIGYSTIWDSLHLLELGLKFRLEILIHTRWRKDTVASCAITNRVKITRMQETHSNLQIQARHKGYTGASRDV